MSDKHKHKDKKRKTSIDPDKEHKRAKHDSKVKSKKGRRDSSEDSSEDSSSANKVVHKKVKDKDIKDSKAKVKDREREIDHKQKKDKEKDKDKKKKDKDKDKKEKHDKKEKQKKAAAAAAASTAASDHQVKAEAATAMKKESKDESNKNEKEQPKVTDELEAPAKEEVGSGEEDPKKEEPAEKKLKAWQDDILEIESGDETEEPSKMQTLSSVATRSRGLGPGHGVAENAGEEELDPLDVFMAELAKTEQQNAKDLQAKSETPSAPSGLGERMGVMDASRVKTITLEEVEGLMGTRKHVDATEETKDKALGGNQTAGGGPALQASSGSSPIGTTGSTAHATGTLDQAGLSSAELETGASEVQSQEIVVDDGDVDDDDNDFHEAFIKEIKRLRGEEPELPQGSEVHAAQVNPAQNQEPDVKLSETRVSDSHAKSNGGAHVDAILQVASTDQGGERASMENDENRGDNNEHDDDDGGDDDDDDDEDDDGNIEHEKENQGLEKKTPKDNTESNSETLTQQEAIPEKNAPLAAQQVDESLPGAAHEPKSTVVSATLPDDVPKKVLTKKEKRRMRREAKEAAAKEQEAKAKKKAKEAFGDEEEQRMESDPDRSEESSEEEQESYFDLVKRFTTKKTLPEVDHSKVNYPPFRKNLYIQVKELTNLKPHEVEDLRRTHGDIRVRGKYCPCPVKSFMQCGLPDKIIKILERRDYDQPFPIQMQAMPALMCGRDVIGVAQTGSGKTLAYLLPVIRHILDQPKLADGDGPIGFVIAPTRELALQIQREAQVFCKAVNLFSVCAFGGGPMGEQLSALKKGAELLVGTPGRLIDVLTTSNGKITNLRRVTFMVLDEADRMFDMGFEPQIGMFLQGTRPDKQVAMFSATLPTHVEALARQVLKKPLEIMVGERNTAANNVTQFVEVLEESSKFYRLLQLLGEWHEHGHIIIFVQQQKDVDEMFTELLKYGYPSLALHGGQDQQDRDFTLQDFKDGVANVLIATSVAARGIDVKQVILVINFKVPDHLEDYIHRIGRTGRAGKHGYAYTFIQPDEGDRAQDMVDALRQCDQKVPEKLKKVAEEHQSLVNMGQAQKKRRWGGFGGKGFKYDSTEKSRQQKDRAKAKKDLMIGEDFEEQEEEARDPWLDDKPMGPGQAEPQQQPASSGSDPMTTAVLAAQTAARLQADAARQAPAGGAPSSTTSSINPPPPAPGAVPPAGEPSAPVAARPPMFTPKTPAASQARKTEKEIEEQAQKMAEETLKNMPEEVREKQLPALMQKLKDKLNKANQEQPSMPPPPAPPSKPPPPPPDQHPVMKALPSVPGVLAASNGPADLVGKSMAQLQATVAKPGAGTSHLAEAQAALLASQNPMAPPGMAMEELEINDYPQVARQKISHKEPLLAIEELTGARCQVKGQHFASNANLPTGARKLYVEIVGPTIVSVQKAKQEVRRMMEALAIRTLNIPGVSRSVTGMPGRYDPLVGK